jgi:hypothetical protein
MSAAPCPRCGEPNDAHTWADGPATEPRADDVTVCFYCGAVGLFTGTGAVRLPSDSEAAELDRNPNVIAVRAAIIEYRAGLQ